METKKIIVIGVGNNGKNVINYLYESFSDASNDFYKNNISLCFIDIDKNTISESKIYDNIFLENEKNKNASDVFLTKEEVVTVVNNNKERVRSKIRDFDIIFAVAGIGGNTGSAAINLICDICREENKILILNVLKPFSFENKKRKDNFISSLNEIKDKTNGILVISNERNLGYSNFSLKKVLENSYKKIFNNIKVIVDLILKKGIIAMDFLELKDFFRKSNFLSIGNSFEYDQGKISEAIDEALFSQFSEIDISEAKRIICVINSYNDIFFNNVDNCLKLISNKVSEAEVKIVVLIDKNVKPGKININIIGNNFKENSTNNYFVLENESSKIKDMINIMNGIFENSKNEVVEEKDILPFFIKEPDNKYGSKK